MGTIMKPMSQIETLKSIRKPATPPTKIIRPEKGSGYRRPRNIKWSDYERAY